MCGAYNVIDNLFSQRLTEFFGVPRLSRFGWQNCGQPIEIILNRGQGNTLETATWWLLLEPGQNGQLKPHTKYTSFNSRWHAGSGFTRASAGPFKTARCIIPASGFVESQDKCYAYLTPQQQAIAFGGLYKHWESAHGPVLSCSMITIPPHPRLKDIHKKAMPLMLPTNNPEILTKWLDPDWSDTEEFLPLMKPALREDFEVTELQKWGAFDAKPGTEPFILSRDGI